MPKEPLLPLPTQLNCRPEKTTGDGPQIIVEQVPEEQVIYIDDDQEPSPLTLLQQQADWMLMSPPSATMPNTQRPPLPLWQNQQPPKLPERKKIPGGVVTKKSLAERRKAKTLKLELKAVATMKTSLQGTHHAQELARLASAVVPLQRLNIWEDTHVTIPHPTLESEMPNKSQEPKEWKTNYNTLYESSKTLLLLCHASTEYVKNCSR